MRYSIDRGQVTITFDGKPADNVRQALKANGFCWNPKARFWWRRRVAGAADVIGAIQKMTAPKLPDGACRKCEAPEGYWRGRGAGAVLLCGACDAADPNRKGISQFIDT